MIFSWKIRALLSGLTVVATLLAAVFPAALTCAPIFSGTASNIAIVAHCSEASAKPVRSCCEVKTPDGAPCCCCAAPPARPEKAPKPVPGAGCSSCACAHPADSVPPSAPTDLGGSDLTASLEFASFDPTAAADSHKVFRQSHDPPLTIDLVISLSRLTC